MKRILSLSVLSVLLAACSTPSDIPPESGGSGPPGSRPSAGDRPPVGAGTQGRWLIHPKAANGIMIEGVEEWSEGDR